MAHGTERTAPELATAVALTPESGWHALHLFYRIDRAALAALPEAQREQGRRELSAALDRREAGVIEQMQAFAVMGHKADFGVVLAGPDLRAVHGVQVAIESSALGPALVPVYSFCSLTEVSEYVPDAEQYGRLLRDREKMDPESAVYKTRVAQYAARLETMNRQRNYPEFPDWPALCFYPMSKARLAGENWYTLPFSVRNELMAEHGKSGMKFAGRVTQVITASTGLDDWEWGVTLWARNPQYLKEIVYTMRFDEASARYALFGPFYYGFLLPPAELIAALRILKPPRDQRIMWTCPKCAAKVDDQFEVCWKCGTSPDGVGDPHFVPADDTAPIADPLYDPIAEPGIPDQGEAPGSPDEGLGEVVEAYQALTLMEAKFIADQLMAEGITAMSDTENKDVVGTFESNPRVYVRAGDFPRARAWLDSYEKQRQTDLNRHMDPN